MYVNNVNDFLEHTKSHVENLRHLSKYILSKAEGSFMIRESLGIPEEANIKEFSEKVLKGMELHDAAKMEKDNSVSIGKHLESRIAKKMTQGISNQDDRIAVAKKLIKRGFSVPEVLYSGYGGNLLSMGEKAESEFFDFVTDTLNRRDADIMNQYIDLNFSENWERNAFMKIEEIVDKVDRGMSPISVEEFGRVVLPASKFMENEDPIIKNLILDCEAVYDSICPRAFYHKRVQEMGEEGLNQTREKISSTTGVYHITKNKREHEGELCTEMYDSIVKEAHEIKDTVSSKERNRHDKTLSELYGAGKKP